MGNVMKYYNGTSWVPVASQYIDPDYAYLKAYDSPSNRNLLHNGAMQVAQRGTSTASITAAGYYTADRWATDLTTLGTWTQSVENDAPTGSGFRKSLKMLVTTADASPASGDMALVAQYLEGQDAQRIAKGTASAQQLTLSFWVKSNVTGTYIAYLYDQNNVRIVSASYSVSASATWEKKSITFPADTTGALNNDNARSLHLTFVLAAGSGATGGTLQTTWGSVSNNYATGQTNLAASTNNYWQITGVQLEIGNVATPFEFEDYATTLRKCQRYYYRHVTGTSQSVGTGFCWSTTAIFVYVKFPQTMRGVPTIDASNGTSYYTFNNTSLAATLTSAALTSERTETGASVEGTISGGTTGTSGRLITANASAYIGWTADL